jgi:hypothetical protein
VEEESNESKHEQVPINKKHAIAKEEKRLIGEKMTITNEQAPFLVATLAHPFPFHSFFTFC